ncbi:MAG: hypothetical protein QOD83_1462 [Solirubrobacteraceae bacterium]|jgi:hypothetical protein|nr:hypothetical protein [Solirubrobacteraceae bacterium]
MAGTILAVYSHAGRTTEAVGRVLADRERILGLEYHER